MSKSSFCCARREMSPRPRGRRRRKQHADQLPSFLLPLYEQPSTRSTMEQYTSSSSAPSFALEPPTPMPLGSFEQQQQQPYHPPSPQSLPMSISSSYNSSRQGTPASSLSSSYRHHPYSAVSADSGHRPRLHRPRSTTSVSDQSDWSECLSSAEGTGSEMELDFDPSAEGARQDATLAMLDFFLELDHLPPLPTLPSASPSSSAAATTPPAPAPKGKAAKGAPKDPKAKTSHARKTPPGHIKRPPNAFIIFRSHCCAPDQLGPNGVVPPGTPTAQQLSELGITDHRHISRIVSHLWKSLSPAEKAYWEDKAQQKKDEHAAAHPDYRYKPVYRNKDEVRRRRKTGRDDTEEEKKACEKLASELLGIDVSVEAPPVPQPKKQASKGGKKATAGTTTPKPTKARAAPQPRPQPESYPVVEEVRHRERWTIETVASALRTEQMPLPIPSPPEKGKRVRYDRYKSNKTSAGQAPQPTYHEQLPFDDSYAQLPQGQSQQHFDPQYVVDRPHTAPDHYSTHADGDFAPRFYPTRRESHTRTQSSQGPDEAYQFGYMVQLDEIMVMQSGPGGSQHMVDPRQLDSAASDRPQTASYSTLPTLSPQEHLERASSSRKGRPVPLDLPYNPTFVPYPPAANFLPQPIAAPVATGYARPASPRSLAIDQMQHYNLPGSSTTSVAPTPRPASPRASASSLAVDPSTNGNGNPVIISPTSRTFSFASVGPGLPPTVPLRRDSELGAPSSAALMGMKRRGTLRATGATGGDLMLISPVTGTFGGRKFSLGRWELPKRSNGGGEAGEQAAMQAAATSSSGLSNELLQTFELDPSFIEFLETQPVAPFGDIAAQLDALMRDGGVAMGDDDGRPRTSASDYSDRPGTSSSDVSHDGSPVLRELDPQAGAAFWRRNSSIDKQHQQFQYSLSAPQQQQHDYHVGQDSFFVPPSNPLVASSSATSPPTQSPPQPAFGSSAFGGSFQPGAHKQSLDAQLAAESAASEKAYLASQSALYAPNVFDHSPHLAQEDWMARRDRGSDATIRGRQDSIRELGLRHEEALRVLQSQLADPEGLVEELGMEGVPEGVDPGLKYCYLTPEQAKDARLVEHIFR